jgi:uncharacterized membrane protein
LAALGLLDASYLSWLKLIGGPAACAGVGDCSTVANSRYAMIGPIPVAVLGAVAYLAVLAVLLAEPRLPSLADTVRLAVFGITLVGTLFSGYLTYLEVAVLRAICPYCVASAIVMTMLLVLSLLRLRETIAGY